MQETTVVLGFEDPSLQEEVLHFLDRLPRVRIVGAAGDGPGLAREVRQSGPDATVVSPEVLQTTPDLNGAAVLVVAQRETTQALRAAVRAGARGFYLWPEERKTLARDAERAGRSDDSVQGSPGRAVAVFGPRGGTGATFLATNLAAACAARGARTVLADLDTFYADVTVALGITPNGNTPTLANLAPVLDELHSEHLERVLYTHPRGFRVLLAPHEPGPSPVLDARSAGALVRALRSTFDLTVLHLPRMVDEATRGVFEAADEVLMTVTLDVLAFRDARRALDYLRGLDLDGRCRLVINRARRAEVIPEDAERVFGMRPAAVIGMDRSVARAQNRGELVAGRSGRAARQIAALARHLLPEAAS